MKYEKLQTPRLQLRQFEESDLDFIFNHFGSPFVSKYLYDNEPPKDVKEAKVILSWCRDFKSEDHIRWCIVLKEENRAMGTIGFHRYDQNNHSAEIGYDLSEKFSRQGYMTEALDCILDYGFNTYNMNRIHASVAIKNKASNNLLKKLGFKLEGVIRDQYFFRGKYYDHNLFSLLRRDKEAASVSYCPL
jgi:ribosomal-protein-alanine N-acetyltransferase